MHANIKICCRCKTGKDLSDFNSDKSFNDKLRPFCRECSKKEWKNRYEKNKLNESERKSAFYQKNKMSILAKTSIWLKENSGYGRSKVAFQRAARRKAAPVWLTNIHLQQIRWYYQAAAMMFETTGIPHDVDHIYPIKGINFSGLHVPWNLRVIRSSENRSKGNKVPGNEKAAFGL